MNAIKACQPIVPADPQGPVRRLGEGTDIIRHPFRHFEGAMIQLVQRQIFRDLRSLTGNG